MTQVVIKRPTWAEILQAEIELTDAQIKALPTTPINVIPAPGAGKVIVFITSFLILDTLAGAYTNLSGVESRARFRYAASGQVSSFLDENSFQFFGAADLAAVTVGGVPTDVTVNGSAYGLPNTLSTITNKAIQFLFSNDVAGNLTGGNAANTLKIKVVYAVMDV